tara:strand:+ start:417 stop:2429 length:2013 start_codon:yes stop_codon:yes gene_type:complete
MANKTQQIIEVITKGAKKSEKEIRGVSGGLARMAKSAGIAAAAYLGASGLSSAIKSATEAYGKQQLAEQKLRFAAGASTEQLIKQAKALQTTTKFGDEAIIAQQAYVKSLGISTKQTEEIISASVDLASAMGISLESAVMNTTKTLSGMQGELGEKLPAAFKELTAEQLKAGEGIKFIAKQFKGTAEVEAQTFVGSMEQITNKLGDAQEALGKVFGPMMLKVAGFIEKAATAAADFMTNITQTDLENTIDDLKELGAEGNAVLMLENVKLTDEVKKVNAELQHTRTRYKDVESVQERIKELSDTSDEEKKIASFLDDKTDKYVKLLSYEKAFDDFQAGRIKMENGLIDVIHLRDGRVKKMTEKELEGMVLRTQTSLELLEAQEGSLETVTKESQVSLQKNAEEIKQLSEVLKLLKERDRLNEQIASNKKIINQEGQTEIEIQNNLSNIQPPEPPTPFTQTEEDEFFGDNQRTAFEDYSEAMFNKMVVDEAARQQQEEDLRLRREFISTYPEQAEQMGMLSEEEEKANKRRQLLSRQFKVVRIAETLQNTIQTANALYKEYSSSFPAPFGQILGAAAYLQTMQKGKRDVEMIKKAQYGADFTTSGPELLLVGDNASGEERVQVTPLNGDPAPNAPSGSTINITGNVMSDDFVENTLIEKIREATRMGENLG